MKHQPMRAAARLVAEAEAAGQLESKQHKCLPPAQVCSAGRSSRHLHGQHMAACASYPQQRYNTMQRRVLLLREYRSHHCSGACDQQRTLQFANKGHGEEAS